MENLDDQSLPSTSQLFYTISPQRSALTDLSNNHTNNRSSCPLLLTTSLYNDMAEVPTPSENNKSPRNNTKNIISNISDCAYGPVNQEKRDDNDVANIVNKHTEEPAEVTFENFGDNHATTSKTSYITPPVKVINKKYEKIWTRNQRNRLTSKDCSLHAMITRSANKSNLRTKTLSNKTKILNTHKTKKIRKLQNVGLVPKNLISEFNNASKKRQRKRQNANETKRAIPKLTEINGEEHLVPFDETSKNRKGVFSEKQARKNCKTNKENTKLPKRSIQKTGTRKSLRLILRKLRKQFITSRVGINSEIRRILNNACTQMDNLVLQERQCNAFNINEDQRKKLQEDAKNRVFRYKSNLIYEVKQILMSVIGQAQNRQAGSQQIFARHGTDDDLEVDINELINIAGEIDEINIIRVITDLEINLPSILENINPANLSKKITTYQIEDLGNLNLSEEKQISISDYLSMDISPIQILSVYELVEYVGSLDHVKFVMLQDLDDATLSKYGMIRSECGSPNPKIVMDIIKDLSTKAKVADIENIPSTNMGQGV